MKAPLLFACIGLLLGVQLSNQEPVDPYAIVRNSQNSLVGQITGIPYLMTLEVPMADVGLCLAVDDNVSIDLDAYTVEDIGIAAYSTETVAFFTPLNASVTYDNETEQLCATVDMTGAAYYVPILRVDDYENVDLCDPDACDVCDGDNSTCSGCDGVPNSGLVADDCGVCDGDNSTCPDCCPGWTGHKCDVQDLCHAVTCSNDGLCDPLTGRCACATGYIGQRCEMPACSGNGYYTDECVCHHGWGGPDCSSCGSPLDTDKTFVCLPASTTQKGYTLFAVKTSDVPAWLSGNKIAALYPSAVHTKAIMPNTYDDDVVFRNCRCEAVEETEESRIAAVSKQMMLRKQQRGPSSMLHPLVGKTNDKLTGARAYRVSSNARRQLAHYQEVQVTIERWNRAVAHQMDLGKELGHLALARVRSGARLTLAKETHAALSREHPEGYSFGGTAVRGWHEDGAVYWVLRDDEPPFFQDTIEECIAESELTGDEMEDLSSIYQDCIDAFEATSGDLSKCTSTCHVHDDDDGLCSSLAIAFWPLLAVCILLIVAVVALGACFFFRPYRVYSVPAGTQIGSNGYGYY